MGTRRINIDEPEFETTDRIDLEFEDDTVEEVPSSLESLGPEERTVLTTEHVNRRARDVFEGLRRDGVMARSYTDSAPTAGRERRRDRDSAARFDDALSLLTQGKLEAAFYGFTELLERQPESKRLWMFVRAIARARQLHPPGR